MWFERYKNLFQVIFSKYRFKPFVDNRFKTRVFKENKMSTGKRTKDYFKSEFRKNFLQKVAEDFFRLMAPCLNQLLSNKKFFISTDGYNDF